MSNLNQILIKQGAEAKLYITKFGNRDALIKERFTKTYRHHILDKFLTQQRLRSEARCIAKCRLLGIPTPSLYFIDTNANQIYMEYISNSITVKDYIDKLDTIFGDKNEEYNSIIMKLSKIIGQILFKMHSANITHGDLTTSNLLIRFEKCNSIKLEDKMEIASFDSYMSWDNKLSDNIDLNSTNIELSRKNSSIDMISNDADISRMDLSNQNFSNESILMSGKHQSTEILDIRSIDGLNGTITHKVPEIFLIDFGLSSTESTPEDKAVDLYVLERALLSTHPQAHFLFSEILQAYSTNYKESVEVINKFNEVRLRGRKRTMVG